MAFMEPRSKPSSLIIQIVLIAVISWVITYATGAQQDYRIVRPEQYTGMPSEHRQKLIQGLFPAGTHLHFFEAVMRQSGLSEKTLLPAKIVPPTVRRVGYSQVIWIGLRQWERIIGVNVDKEDRVVSAFIADDELGL